LGCSNVDTGRLPGELHKKFKHTEIKNIRKKLVGMHARIGEIKAAKGLGSIYQREEEEDVYLGLPTRRPRPYASIQGMGLG
jgi:hypothetical protein